MTVVVNTQTPKGVYSGNVDNGTKIDQTPEGITLMGDRETRWSVMSSGWQPSANDPPMSGDYIAFSIEELLTSEFPNIDTVHG